MDPKAIVKAQKRLFLAQKTASEMGGVWGDGEAFADRWFTFLVAAKGVYITLKKGAEQSPQSRQWFAGVERKRRETPLYQYLFQARDDDMHGLGQITEFEPGALYLEDEAGAKEPTTGMVGRELLMRIAVFSKEASGSVRVTGQVPMTRLLPVVGRGPVTYNPPTQHEGFTFGVMAPIEMAHLAVEHLSSVLREAEGLA